MKKSLTLVAFAALFTATSLAAQAPKYVLVEHFTNTRCSICASQNPGFYNRISIDANPKMHHISIHSMIPYTACVYYQANTVPQDARASFYGLQGTPSISINGAALTSAGSIDAATIANAYGAKTSPIAIQVAETTVGTTRTASLKIKTIGAKPTGTFKLYVAVVEKKTTYAAPNGEGTHYDVFRKFLTVSSGDDGTLAPTGSEVTASYGFPLDASWNAAETYVVAWIQNATTKEVLNSGSRFDPIFTATNEPSIDANVTISPNPTTGKMTVNIVGVTPQYLTVQNAVGQVVESVSLSKSTSYELNLSSLAAGIYFVKVKSSEGVAVKKVIKN